MRLKRNGMSDYTLDARRLICPMPVIRTQDKIKTLKPGDVLEVICTDPGCLHDIPAWCRVHGHTIISMLQQSHEIVINIQVGN